MRIKHFLDCRHFIVFAAPLGGVFFTACIPNDGTITNMAAKTMVTAGAPVSGTSTNGAGGASLIALKQAVRSQWDSANNMDLIGDGSGAIGLNCRSTSSSGSTGGNTCQCNYTYTKPDGTVENFNVQTIYTEANLIRCSLTSIPKDVTKVTVTIHVTSADVKSNEVTFNVNLKDITNNLDLTDPNNFAEVKRHNCQSILTLRNVLDTSIYDPIQSVDSTLTYPLDFYTSNMGGTIAKWVQEGKSKPNNGGGAKTIQEGWDCTSFKNTKDDLNPIFSTEKDNSGNNNIYSPGGNNYRSRFYLAKESAGAFSIPVHAYIAPRLIDRIGYGAAPTPDGSGGESCPASNLVNIPSGYQWVKVWLFRSSLPGRQYAWSTKFANLTIGCNPGYRPNESTTLPGAALWNTAIDVTATTPKEYRIIPDCSASPAADPPSAAGPPPDGGYTTKILNGNFADRFISHPSLQALACFRPSTLSSSDTWKRINYNKSVDCSSSSSVNDTTVDLGCLQPNTNTRLAAPSGNNLQDTKIQDSTPTLLPLDGPISRYDFLLVVTPPSVQTKDMKNGDPDIVGAYYPFRFPNPSDCALPNDASNCSVSKKLTYDLKLHDITANGDEVSGRLPVFPVCALQPQS